MSYVVAVREGGPEEAFRFVGPFRSPKRAAQIARRLNAAFDEVNAADPESTAWAYVEALHPVPTARELDAIRDWALGRQDV